MFEKSCRCGKSKMNFKIDIGPFYVTDCCEAEGYDAEGNKALKELTDEEKDLAAQAANSSDAENLTITDDSNLDAEPANEETPEPQQSPVTEETKKSNKRNRNK